MAPWKRTLALIVFAQFVAATGFSVMAPFLAFYIQSLDKGYFELSVEVWSGLVYSVQAVAMAVTAPIWGALADRYGRKLMVARAMFGGATMLFGMAFVRSAEELVLLRVAQGLMTGTISTTSALLAASVPRERAGYAMSMLQVGLWSGVALGPLIGGVVADLLGMRATFVVTAGLLVVGGLVVWLGVEEAFAPRTGAAGGGPSMLAKWRQVMAVSGVAPTYLLHFLSRLGYTMVVPIIPLFVQSLLPYTTYLSTWTGIIVGVSSAAGTVCAIYLGQLGDRLGHRPILAACALAAGLFYVPQSLVSEAWQLLILQLLAGAAVGGIIPTLSALLASYAQLGEEGVVYGLDTSVMSAARAMAPMAGAGVALWMGLRGTFVVVGLIFLLAALLAIWCLPKIKMTHLLSGCS